jgi:cysteine synthase A
MPDTYDAARYRRAGRGKIFDSILDTIGDTPLVRLPHLTAEIRPKGEVVAKLEFFNPLASVKDRIGVGMIEWLEANGHLKPGGTIVEPTSGNTACAGHSWRRPRATDASSSCPTACRWSGARCC